MAFDVSYFGLTQDTLPPGWREGRLDSIASFNPEQIGRDYPHQSIQYLDISSVNTGYSGEPVRMTIEDAPSRAQRLVTAGDTILSTVRPGNRAYAFLKTPPGDLVVSTGFAVLRARDCDPRFLYYMVTSKPLIDYLASIAEEKSAYPSVRPEDIAECRIPIPPLPVQREIASILGAFDDKIELNRRMNETLEAMARALFKCWFVDFEPVRMKWARYRRGGLLPGWRRWPRIHDEEFTRTRSSRTRHTSRLSTCRGGVSRYPTGVPRKA